MLYEIWKNLLTELSVVRIDYWPFWVGLHVEGYKVRAADTIAVMHSAVPGDVLVRGYDHYLGSKLIGKWSHVGIVYDKYRVLHAVHTGVHIEHMIDFCRCDRIAVMRPRLAPKDIETVIKNASNFIGKPYDFSFNFKNSHALSCTELMWDSFADFHDVLGMVAKESAIFGPVVKPIDVFGYTGFEKIMEKS